MVGWRYILGRRGWVNIFYGWAGVNGHFIWVGGDGWKYILGGLGLVDIHYGWVGVSRGIF